MSNLLTSRESRTRASRFSGLCRSSCCRNQFIIDRPRHRSRSRAGIGGSRIDQHLNLVSVVNVKVQSESLVLTRFRCLRFTAGSDHIITLVRGAGRFHRAYGVLPCGMISEPSLSSLAADWHILADLAFQQFTQLFSAYY